MAQTSFGTNHPLTVKLWAKKTFSDAVKSTLYGQLIGTSKDSIIQLKSDLKEQGDRLRFGIRLLPTGIGVQDDETLEGNEESLEFRDFDLYLGEKRHAFKVEMNLSAQRTMYDVRSEMAETMQEWLEEYIDTTVMEYLTGRGQGSAATVSKYHPRGALGGNALNDFANDRQVFGGTATSLATLTAGSTMTVRIIDRLIDIAKLASPTMRKARINGRRCWVLILHPYQISALRNDTGATGWFELNRAVTQGGTAKPIMEEALAIYRDVCILESTRVPTFLAGASGDVPAARGVFLGAQAAVTAHGRGADNRGILRISEQSKDYGKYMGSGATLIWGMQRVRFAGQSDFASIAVNTAAAPV